VIRTTTLPGLHLTPTHGGFPEQVAVPCTVTLSTVDELDAYFKSLLDRYETPVVYVAHPVAGAVAANIKAAYGWLEWLWRRWPRIAFMAPWIVEAHVHDDTDPDDREGALLRTEAIVSLADAVLLIGGRISVGMERERICALHSGGDAVDFTRAGANPPVEVPRG
jgi:hypothetical protein